MRKIIGVIAILISSCVLAGPSLTGAAVPEAAKAEQKAPENVQAVSSGTITAVENIAREKFKPFYIYTDEKSQKNHYFPSGWMGDIQDLKFTGAYQDNPKLGKTCLRIIYLGAGPKEWAGIYWQNPANNWGTSKGGYDIRGAQYLTFWMRGEKGGEKISEIKMGGITGKIPDSDIAWIGPLKLKKEWTQYRVSLKKKDMRYISGGFCFTVLKADNPHGCTFYLDEMRYE